VRAGFRGLGRDALHLGVLSSFAIAQPLFDKLGKYPAFFAAHDLDRWEVVGFGVLLVLVPVLTLIVIEAIGAFGGERVRWTVHLIFIGLLASIIVLQVVRRWSAIPPWLIFAISIAIGAALACAYARIATIRAVLSVLGVAPLVFLALFLLASPTAKLVTGGTARAYNASGSFRPPIVMLVFDAFPGLQIQTPDHEVDAGRYPNLAKIAHDGVWYRNSTTVHENTVFSVPSILDGKYPKKGTQPVVQDHPNNLFTLLGKTYEMNVAEEATNLCPPGLCSHPNHESFRSRMRELFDDVSTVYGYLALPKSYQDDLPQITDKWAGFGEQDAARILADLRSGRVGRYDRSIGAIHGDTARPQLNFAHVFFPHEPRQYLPGGKTYQAGASPTPSLGGPASYDNAFLTQQGEQREILQIGFTDRLVGQLINRLRQQGIYDQTMIVIVSDHGESFIKAPAPQPPFVPGKLGYRRAVTKENIQDVGSNLTMIKYPEGHGPTHVIDSRYVRTIDILPTIADVLGLKPLPFKVDGKSLLDRSYKGQSEIKVETTAGDPVTMPSEQWQARREESLQRRISLFGWDDAAPGIYGGIGPRRDLIGTKLSSQQIAAGGGMSASIEEPQRFVDYDPDGVFCPCQIVGRLHGVNGQVGRRDIAVALNGEIVATGKTFEDLGPNKLNWSVMLPESKLRKGKNDLRVFLIGRGALLRIARAP
jgi:hypothetical protein